MEVGSVSYLFSDISSPFCVVVSTFFYRICFSSLEPNRLSRWEAHIVSTLIRVRRAFTTPSVPVKFKVLCNRGAVGVEINRSLSTFVKDQILAGKSFISEIHGSRGFDNIFVHTYTKIVVVASVITY